MKNIKIDLDKKVSDEIFEVIHIYGDNGEEEGQFRTLQEAKEKALEEKERYFQNDSFYIYKMVWSEEESQYVNQYDKTGGLLPPLEVV